MWTKLEHFNQLEILDLSYNALTVVETFISRNLSILNLANNQIAHLSNGFLKDARSLKTLFLNHNKLTVINQTTFLTNPNHYLEILSLKGNPFQCSCDGTGFYSVD